MKLRMHGESRRQWGLKMDLLAGDGVVEVQKLGVQEVASIAREAREIFKRMAREAVEWIAYQRVADGG